MTSIKQRLIPQLQLPWLRRAWRAALWLLAIAYFGFALLFLLLRYAVLPQIENYRADVEQSMSAALHQPVAITKIGAGWQGLRPRLDLYGLRIQDSAGRPALSLDHVEAVIGWSSVLYLRPRLHRLALVAPDLAIRRDAAGHLFVAGLAVNTNAQDNGFGDWLLEQDEIVVTDATVTWTDELRRAPPLSMSKLDLLLENGFRQHRFGVAFDPPREMASRVDLRGDLVGGDLKNLKSWHGEIYSQVGYADLAIWRNWVAYPLELPQGRGALRVWFDFANLQPTALTADVALTDTQLRLAKDLPLLDLHRIEGRIRGQSLGDGFAASLTQLSLATREGLHLQPTDMSLRWQAHNGQLDANSLDLATLNRLAAYLPLPTQVRGPLVGYAPGGKLRDLKLEWGGRNSLFETYRVSGRFEALRLAAQGAVPGFSGLSGQVDGDERGGRIEFSSRDATLDLPAIFPEPHLTFSALDVKTTWKRAGNATELTLTQAAFHNQDATSKASGTYTWRPGTAGEIDLDAKVTHAEGGAVWRYMPFAVGKDAREWLHTAIIGGASEGVTLKLKGDLARFPFADGSGVFIVKGAFHGPTLRFATSWPEITDISGGLEFNGARMIITASSGKILGATVGPVKAEIADLRIPEELLTVEGKAVGPTAEFLKYIEVSPVGGSIDHFTEDMSASGTGELNLKLLLPLRQLDKTQLTGGYRFDGNRVVPLPGMPPVEDVHGRIEFTASDLSAKGLQGRILGGPVKVDVKTQGEGMVLVTASGDASVAQLRQQYTQPIFEHLSGATHWNATIRAQKKTVEAKVSSTLQGIVSSLPEPFNKTATDSMPLVLERKLPDMRLMLTAKKSKDPVIVNRDQIEFSLGKVVRAKVIRRYDAGVATLERGTIAIGDVAPKWPERGVALAVSLPRVDVDFWRKIAGNNNSSNASRSGDGDGGSRVKGLTQLDLRVAEMTVFGRTLHDFRIAGTHQPTAWNLDVKSREIIGKLDWADGSNGKLSGRISQFSLPNAVPGDGAASEALSELPNIDLVFDHVVMAGKDLGEVRVAAENKGGFWNATLGVQNEEASLTGQGKWRPEGEAADTRLDFKLKTRSIEKSLAHAGYANAVRRGNATLEGSLSWNGAPYAVDYPSLNGSLKLDARNGQFNKLDPSVVGRLLGIISLQSLPRRITLDFRDVFSEGFAFDAITANAAVTNGVIDTRDMEIRGPAAKVQMAGTVDLAHETQDLKVRVKPALGESAATAALLIHPAVGATVWVLNKVFGNPVDAAFAFDYSVTGSWADPKVEKLGAQAGGAKDNAAKENAP